MRDMELTLHETPLSASERERFRKYAEANLEESDGSQSEWADHTLRLLGERDHLNASREKLHDAFAEMERERDAALRELERLCGPVCPHDGCRAIEHEIPRPGWEFADGAKIHMGELQNHPRWREGEAWLRERAK